LLTPALKYLTFALDVDDGWPPVAAEGMPLAEEADGLRVLTPPLFIKDLAVGDYIEVLEETEDQVFLWRSVRKSDHSTVWILPNKRNIQRELEELRSLGCSTASFPGELVFAIDLPPNVASAELDTRFGPMAPGVAVAYPAWRHED
jgi:hypothetical protein